MTSLTSPFDGISYLEGRVVVNGVEFWTDPRGTVPFEELDPHRFTLYKGQPFIEDYRALLANMKPAPQRIVELGMWDGASLAFWASVFQPEKIVGIDLKDRGDSPRFREWLTASGLADRVRSYWNVDQSDKAHLREIVSQEFPGGSLDLVLDDCSHRYGPTKASFEVLFPLLRQGGLYIVEDWDWEYSGLHPTGVPAAREVGERDMTDFVAELVRVNAAESRNHLLTTLSIKPKAFVAAERGPGALRSPADWALEQVAN